MHVYHRDSSTGYLIISIFWHKPNQEWLAMGMVGNLLEGLICLRGTQLIPSNMRSLLADPLMGCEQVSPLGCQSEGLAFCWIPGPPDNPSQHPMLLGYTGLGHPQYLGVTLDLWAPHLLLPRQLIPLLVGTYEIGRNHISIREPLQSDLRSLFHSA